MPGYFGPGREARKDVLGQGILKHWISVFIAFVLVFFLELDAERVKMSYRKIKNQKVFNTSFSSHPPAPLKNDTDLEIKIDLLQIYDSG